MQGHKDEQWRPVIGYTGLYEVSDMGRVRRTAPGQGAVLGRILKPDTSSGYLRVNLHDKDGGKTHLVHTLVLEAFVGPRGPGMECCHWDGDKSNARLDNLRWGTSSENNEDIIRLGRSRQANQTHCKRGHELSDPNIYRRGRRRACKSCSWEFSRAQRKGESFDPARADENYERLQAGLQARNAEARLKALEKEG